MEYDKEKKQWPTWREGLAEAMTAAGDYVMGYETTLTDEELDVRPYSDVPWSAWGDKFVYFPCTYDGKFWVGWAPRNPCDFKTGPIG